MKYGIKVAVWGTLLAALCIALDQGLIAQVINPVKLVLGLYTVFGLFVIYGFCWIFGEAAKRKAK